MNFSNSYYFNIILISNQFYTNINKMTTVYIVYEIEDKACNCEVLGVFTTKDLAIKSLLKFTTDNHLTV